MSLHLKLCLLAAGEAHMRLNRPEEAAHWYRESLRSKPDHIPAHLTYGKLLSIVVGPLRLVVREGTASKQSPVFVRCVNLGNQTVQSN